VSLTLTLLTPYILTLTVMLTLTIPTLILTLTLTLAPTLTLTLTLTLNTPDFVNPQVQVTRIREIDKLTVFSIFIRHIEVQIDLVICYPTHFCVADRL
jgi:hypothetical protein